MKIELKKVGAIAMLFLSMAVLISCEKDDPAPDSGSESTTPFIGGTVGSLWAIKTVTDVNTGGISIGGVGMTIQMGTAVAVFMEDGKKLDVGTVSVNGTTLSKVSDAYISMVSATQPTGLDFSSGVNWAVTGGNGYSAFNHKVVQSFPSVGTFTAAAELSKTSSYTVSFSSVSGADSILYMVNDVVKTVAGNVKSYTFTADQLSKVAKGTALVQAVPYNYRMSTYGGKKIAFGTEVVYSKSVTVK